jgi:putative ABC transport system permease protein
MLSITWIAGLMRRRPGRLIAAALGTALAVGLLASIGTFLSSSKAVMTKRASASVAVHWQVEAQRGADAKSVFDRVAAFPGVSQPTKVDFGQTTGFMLTSGDTTQSTGAGVVLGLPDNYGSLFPDAIRTLSGASRGVLLAQQTAANLHAATGDTITFGRIGLPDTNVRVVGIIDLPSADSLFQKVGAPSTQQPSAPPDNVLILPPALWHQFFDPLAASRPDLVTEQVHAMFTEQLPADPSAAYVKVEGEARNLELKLAGDAFVGNNLGAVLAKARSDSLYAQILFLFLGVPGAVLAGLLTATVAASGTDRRRRDQALLRARGATIRQLVRLGLAEAGLVGLLGSVLGIIIALTIGATLFGNATFGAGAASTTFWAGGSILIGLVIAALSISWPSWRDAREVTVTSARQSVGRAKDPRWMRWYVDLMLVAGSLVVFWLTSRNGYKLVLAVEGVASISVNYWAFLGPALAWLGGGMLMWRLANTALRYGRRPLGSALRPFVGGLSGTIAASMSRQRKLLARGLTLVALTAMFAGSTAIFNSTYRAQAEIDAVLTNGAMVSVVQSPGQDASPSETATLAKINGVRSVTSLQHRYAYVGADLQDLYGVDPNTVVKATKLRDTYFQGGTASQLMAKLATRPNGVLLSFETVKDFQLSPGDTVKLRLQDGKTKTYRSVPFVYVGVVNEFPSAPSDSFIVANAAYIAEQTGSDAVGMFLIDTAPDASTAVAKRVQQLVGTSGMVKDIASSRRKIGSSLTAVELGGLTKVELGFALVLAAAASGLVLWLGLAERKRTFAIAAALGAKPRQLGGFIWSEALFVTIGGLGLGVLSGWGLTHMIVKVLKGVFDPAPSSFSVPWAYLGFVALVVAAAVLAATLAITRATRRPTIEMLRDL